MAKEEIIPDFTSKLKPPASRRLADHLVKLQWKMLQSLDKSDGRLKQICWSQFLAPIAQLDRAAAF